MTLPALDANAKDWIQAISWAAAVAAGVFGIVKIVVEAEGRAGTAGAGTAVAKGSGCHGPQ